MQTSTNSTATSRNLAARMGRWSAQHRKKAIFGWLAFVVAALVIGGAVGTKTLDDEDTGVGESRQRRPGDREGASPTRAPTRRCSCRARPRAPPQPRFRAAVDDTIAAIRDLPGVRRDREPVRQGRGRSPRTGAPPWSGSRSRVTTTASPSASTTSLAAVDAVDRRNDGLRVEQFGDASADKALDEGVRGRLPARRRSPRCRSRC